MKLPPIKNLTAATGYTPTHIRRVLSGKQDPSLKLVRKLASELNVTIDQLIAYIDANAQECTLVQLWPLEKE